MYENPWLYNEQPFESENIADNFGFVYEITNLSDGTKYIGRKYFYSMRKNPKTKRRKKSESDWKAYWSSSDIIKSMIAEHGNSSFRREIIALYKTRGGVNYGEVSEQFKRDVLVALKEDGTSMYINDNIGGKYFRKNVCKYV